MFELSGVNYEEVLEQGDSISVRATRGFELPGGSSYPGVRATRGFELPGGSSYPGVRVIGIILYSVKFD